MKTVFAVEAIGLSPAEARAARRAGTEKRDHLQARPRVCELTGLLGRGYRRSTPLRPKEDWTEANSTGSRGVQLYWTLTAGPLYEARYRTAFTAPHILRYLYVTPQGDLRDATEEEAREWLSHLRPAPALS